MINKIPTISKIDNGILCNLENLDIDTRKSI